jgi:predicted alpha-1,2-mannosidase
MAVFATLLSTPSLQVAALAQQPVDLVNVLVGTAAEGQTYPAAGVPFAMTQWTPQTRAGEVKCVAPYYAADTKIQGFRGTHFLSGSCTQDYGSFTLMPLSDDHAFAPEERASTFDRATEQATPYRYAVDLKDSRVHAEITGSERTGMMLFRFAPEAKTGWLVMDNNVRTAKGTLAVDSVRHELTGANPVYRIYAGNGKSAGFSGYIVAQFDQPFTEVTIPVRAGSPQQVAIRFHLPADHMLRVRIGTSFTSIDEARRNLSVEQPSWEFATAVAYARKAWSSELDRIQVAGDSPDRAIFYTAMYHAFQLPRIFSDRDGSYPRFADGGALETAKGFTFYTDYSVWDTFRAVHPLFTLLDPARDTDMVKSLIAMGEQGGFLPIFPAWNSYTSEMTGDHADAIITDAYMKGLRGFDAEAAFRLMKKNATQEPATLELYQDGRGRRALDSYLKYGYIPLEDRVPNAFHGDEQVSRTMDYAFDDFEVATLARALGHSEDAAAFSLRALNYRNVIDPTVGFARGRHADGSWATPFDPSAKVSYITEATPYINTFFVPQDIPGLIERVGGPSSFIAKLDGLFASGNYDHGNEPSHHIAYLYDDAGAPAKTQMHVHRIMSTLYRNSTDGLAGNDDAGQMSAWYVFSALGFYPVTPGIARYSLGTPHFDEATLHLPNGKSLHIRAAGAEQGSFIVRSVSLNGLPLGRLWITHEELLSGGELVFTMASQPAP